MAQVTLAVLTAIVFATFRHYGISWDEEIQSQYGQAIFDFYNSGFVDHRYNQIFNLYLYGGMFDGLAAFVNAYTPIGIYETRHLLNALVGLLGLWGAWRLGRLMGGGQVGFFTLVLLALTPMYYGHMFNNPKDIPFACGVVWTLYYMAKTLRAFPAAPLRLLITLGLVFGLTLGVRVGGVMLLGYWALSMGLLSLSMLVAHARSSAPMRNIKRIFRYIWYMTRIIVPVCAIAYAIMLICWPWAQESPIYNPVKAFITFSHFPQDVEVLLNGTIYRSTELPWYYTLTYLTVQIPLPHLILIILGILLIPLIYNQILEKPHKFSFILILLTVLVPLVFASTQRPALYDAVRHFIFTLPSLCVLAAFTLKNILTTAFYRIEKHQNKKIRQTLLASLIAVFSFFILSPAYSMARLHPYEYIYINLIEDGVKGGFGHYELDYWGSSFKEAAEKLHLAVTGEGGIPPGKIMRIAICGPWSSAMIYLPADYAPVEADKPAEFFLSTTRWMCQNMREGKEIVRVERMDVPLSVIKDLRGLKGYRPDNP